MRLTAMVFFSTGLFAQNNDLTRSRPFNSPTPPTVQQFQEVATVIRTIADIREVATDNDQKSVTVHATDGQIAMAEWLFNELDTQTIQVSVPHQYLIPGSTDDVISLFYLTDCRHCSGLVGRSPRSCAPSQISDGRLPTMNGAPTP